MIQVILGGHQVTRSELLGGIIIVSGCGALMYCTSKFWRYAATAPYSQNESNRVTRALQRAIIDKTKTRVGDNFYPLDSLRTTEPRRSTDNGHAISGAVRDAARRLIDEAIRNVGGDKFEINPNRNSSTGSRSHFQFAVGDLEQDFCNEQPSSNAYIVGIDIDYYLRHPDEILQFVRPVVLHTFNPRKVSGNDGDSTFTIIDNKVRYLVGGGSEWNHYVYDWCRPGEFVTSRVWASGLTWVAHSLLRLLGVEKVCYHKIHHCRPWTDCPDRALVYTIPQYTVWRFRWIESEITTRELKRITYQDSTKPGWNRIEHVNSGNELMVSIGREGEHAQVTIEKSRLDMLSGLSATQSVNARLIGMGIKDTYYTAMIVQYFTGKKTVIPVISTIHKPTMPRVHWPVTSEADAPEVSARQYSYPLISDSMMMPMIKRWETMSESIEHRVTFVTNTKKPSDKIAALSKQFVELMNGNYKHTLIPLTIGETIERLNKPSQVLQCRAVFEFLGIEPRELIDSFNKNEPGMKSSRIISGFADIQFIIKVSRYTFAYADVILKAEHNKHWYLPGRPPIQIVDRVCEFTGESGGQVAETDYSNLDGRVSEWMQRNIGQRSMVDAFLPEYRDEIISYYNTLINCPARAKRFGFRYEAGPGVKSGSPTTTQDNSKYSGCVQYVALSFQYPYATPEQLWAMMGPISGDDGICHSSIASTIGKAAKAFGLEVKVEKYNPEIGLCFLSRVYIDPLNTTTTMQDPLRTLRKLHITTRDPTIPIDDAACDRVEGYLCTDALTPLIGDYCRMVLRLRGPNVKSETARAERRSRNKEKPFWLTCDGSWPQLEEDVPLMKYVISKRTGIDEDKMDTIIGTLRTMTDIWEPITYDTQESNVKNTIDEEGITPGSVDESLAKLNDAKQTRANPSTTRPRQGGSRASTSHEVSGRTAKRAKGPRQPARLRRQSESNSRQDGNVAAHKTERNGVPGGQRTTGRKDEPRRPVKEARACRQNTRR